MRTTLAAIAALTIIAGCSGSRPPPQSPAAGRPAAAAAVAQEIPVFAVPDQALEERGYVMEITRTYENDAQALLIKKAEEVEPPREDVLALIGDEKKQAHAGVRDSTPLWWFARFDGVYIPYAITADALVFYHSTFEAFHSGDFSICSGIVMKKVTLVYEASVSHEQSFEQDGETFEDVHVVRMSLRWSQYCGGECAMGFHKERVVVFGAQGEVLGVFLDGETPYIVS